MEYSISRVAQACHEANKIYCQSIGDNSQPSWEDAPVWQKESAIKGIMFHAQNPNATPEDSHNSWLMEKSLQGWKFGEVKDPDKKEHPCYVPYNMLPENQKVKDSLFMAICNSFIK